MLSAYFDLMCIHQFLKCSTIHAWTLLNSFRFLVHPETWSYFDYRYEKLNTSSHCEYDYKNHLNWNVPCIEDIHRISRIGRLAMDNTGTTAYSSEILYRFIYMIKYKCTCIITISLVFLTIDSHNFYLFLRYHVIIWVSTLEFLFILKNIS